MKGFWQWLFLVLGFSYWFEVY